MGTVTGTNGVPVPGASIVLQGPLVSERRTASTNSNGFFEIHRLDAETPYRVAVTAEGFKTWSSSVTLKPGQLDILTGIKLRIAALRTTVTVSSASTEEIATEQVNTELKQRALGFVPNFYEVFAPNPAPLTAKLKFELAFRVAIDPVTLAGVGILAGSEQLSRTPNYGGGWQGFGERLGANYANQFTNLMIGGAILPSLLHQDPRYFYQGTGSKKSRLLHAISAIFITKGDNGRLQPNYSELGGDLSSAAISNLYYPQGNRGVGLVFENFAIDTAIHMSMRILQEFVFPSSGLRIH